MDLSSLRHFELFWICIHYSGPKEAPRAMPKFDRWNYLTSDELAKMKAGTINNERRFWRR
jgi:hypothetical protein